jgi:lysophospholipase L1-like esterase
LVLRFDREVQNNHRMTPLTAMTYALRGVHRSILLGAVLAFSSRGIVLAQEVAPAATTLHPALFLVGDSITKTGKPPGDTGPWGMGYEIAPMFDAAKIHVYNEGAGGRSSRSYIDEGLWAKILERMQPGDFVLIMFGHNDSANSANYPDRTTIGGDGEETIQTGVGDQKKNIHSYGWYLRQYVKDAKAKGATVILCSPVMPNGRQMPPKRATRCS